MRKLRLAIAGLAALPFALLGQFNAGESEEQVTLEVGDDAPDFSLPASDGNEYKLSEVLKDGPVVLAWFPKADTPGCTAQCKSIAKNGDMIREYKVTYFMISVDTVEDNTKFAEKYSADFPILSDTTKEVANEYGVLRTMGKYTIPARDTFYIGTDGKILKIERNVKVNTAAEDMAANLKELNVDRVEST
ncbi:MAG: peroxiredoxin [Gammaproteobacteria bacterium]|nr:peroxiredoxin [Gammaproteobacteria bacterium]